jgi:hypothetical protein
MDREEIKTILKLLMENGTQEQYNKAYCLLLNKYNESYILNIVHDIVMDMIEKECLEKFNC